VLASLEALGVTHEVWDRTEHVALRAGEIAIWTPEAGYVSADATCRALWRLVQAGGAEVRHERASGLEGYDRVLLAPGPWIRDWVDLPARVTRQTVAYVRGVRAGPVWIQDSEALEYGFPSEPGTDTFKIGIHRQGPEVDPDDASAEPSAEDLAAIRRVAHDRFGIAKPDVVETVTCLYTNLPGDEFSFGPWGDRGFYASACSGHGFKFGLWSGQKLVDLAEGSGADGWLLPKG
jgi:glycine/D-amino acid oxidase-like deaminating enzyme